MLVNAAFEVQRLRQALREIYEVYAGSEGVKKPLDEVADYLLGMVETMKDIAAEALREEKK